MKKKLLTVVIVLLTLAVLAVLFVPRTTRVQAKLENDNAEILQVDIKSRDYLLLKDKAEGYVRLTTGGELWSYEFVNIIIDPNGKNSPQEYPLYSALWRYDDDSLQLVPATLFFDKDLSYFVLRSGNDRYRFAADDVTADTIAFVDDYVA